jgi:hypothetical protein
MGLFFKRNKKDTNPSKNINNTNKNTISRYLMLTLYYLSFKSGGEIDIKVDITSFDNILNNISSTEFFQKAWNDVKERFGREVDEQELYKVFMFLMFMFMLGIILEFTKQKISPPDLVNNRLSYNHYRFRGTFNGNLNEKTFKELVEKIWNYLDKDFLEQYRQYIEQEITKIL